MNPVNQEIKQELKNLIKIIITHKNNFKDSQRKGKHSWVDLQTFSRAQWEYRHRHIARCLLRGRTYEQIEQKTRDDNKPDKAEIIVYQCEYEERFKKQEETHYAEAYAGA